MAPDSTAAALALIKPSVRAQTAYTLDAPPAPRKLNQNESPFDAPPVVKEAVLGGLRERSEEHTSELQSRLHLVCRLLLEKKKKQTSNTCRGHATVLRT